MSKTSIFALFSDACAEMNMKVQLLRQRGDLKTKTAGSIISHQLTRIYAIRDCAAADGLDFSYTIKAGVITAVKSSTDSTWCCKTWNSELQAFCENVKEEVNLKHNEYSVRVRTWIDGEQFLDEFIIGPDREYRTLNDLYEDLCKQLQLALDHFEIIVDSN